jgi:hypothetical protein
VKWFKDEIDVEYLIRLINMLHDFGKTAEELEPFELWILSVKEYKADPEFFDEWMEAFEKQVLEDNPDSKDFTQIQQVCDQNVQSWKEGLSARPS